MENKRVPIYPVFVNHQDCQRGHAQNRVQVAPENHRCNHPQHQHQQHPQDFDYNSYAALQQNAANFAYGPAILAPQPLPQLHPQAVFYAQPVYMPAVQNLEPQLRTHYAVRENQRALLSDHASEAADHPTDAPRYAVAKKLLAHLEAIEHETKNYVCLSYLHRISMTFTFIFMLLGGLYGIISFVLAPDCPRGVHRDSDDVCNFFNVLAPDVLMLFILLGFISGVVTITIDYHAISAYTNRSYSKMRCFYFLYLIFLIMSVIQFNLLGIAVYGYLFYAASKLVPLFRERKKTTEKLVDMGVEQSTIEHTINPQA